MSVAISWAKKVQLAEYDISVSFPKSSHTFWTYLIYVSTVLLSIDTVKFSKAIPDSLIEYLNHR